jgi:hypothetical protein
MNQSAVGVEGEKSPDRYEMHLVSQGDLVQEFIGRSKQEDASKPGCDIAQDVLPAIEGDVISSKPCNDQEEHQGDDICYIRSGQNPPSQQTASRQDKEAHCCSPTHDHSYSCGKSQMYAFGEADVVISPLRHSNPAMCPSKARMIP